MCFIKFGFSEMRRSLGSKWVHLSLGLSILKKYHRRGIGRTLTSQILIEVKERLPTTSTHRLRINYFACLTTN
jgi:ribosomal protein S18 acetylase RimI-like enzyme